MGNWEKIIRQSHLDANYYTQAQVAALLADYALDNHNHSFSELSDTDITSPANGHLLKYDSGKWVNEKQTQYLGLCSNCVRIPIASTNWYYGNPNGWSDITWSLSSSGTTPSIPKHRAPSAVVLPIDITALTVKGAIGIDGASGHDINVRFYAADRPDGAGGSFTLTQIGSTVTISCTAEYGRYDLDLSAQVNLSAGKLIFMAVQDVDWTTGAVTVRATYTMMTSF